MAGRHGEVDGLQGVSEELYQWSAVRRKQRGRGLGLKTSLNARIERGEIQLNKVK